MTVIPIPRRRRHVAVCSPHREALGPLTMLAFDAAPVALAVAAPDGHWVQVNQAMCDLLGYPAEQLLGDAHRTLTHPDDLPLDEQAAAAPAVEKRYRHADGRMVWVRVTAGPIHGPDGALLGAVVSAEDIAERRVRDAELARLALHDPLTGVRNRALLDEDIDRALRNRDTSGGVVAVFYVDIDDFKGVNDRHGHEVGDQVLVTLTTRLREALRDHDTVARLGGDEFALVAHLPTAADAADMADRVERVCTEPLTVGHLTLPVRASVGMAVVATDGCAPAEALAAADRAMYVRKRAGKSAVPS